MGTKCISINKTDGVGHWQESNLRLSLKFIKVASVFPFKTTMPLCVVAWVGVEPTIPVIYVQKL